MNIYKPLFTLFSILVLLTPHTNAQTKKSHEIAAFMKQSYEKERFNGTVLVAQNNSILYNASFGYTDASKTEKLTTDYRFHIGSITKEFSAIALIQLQEQGRLKIEDKVSKFIPELPAWANDVSLRDLLRYTSGIPDVNWKKIKNDNDLLEGLQQVDSLDFKPGTQYDYNNNNLFLRQFIIERVTGMSFKTYAEQFLFKPCKMNASVMTPFENEKNIAKGFNNQLVADKPDLPITGGTYLTTADLLKWADCLHSHKLISANAIYELGQHFDQPETQSALGEVTFHNRKLLQHIHDGRAGNYEALLVTNREEKYTIILLGNNHHGKLFEIADAITVLLKSGE